MRQKLLVDVVVKAASVSLHAYLEHDSPGPGNQIIDLPLDPEVRISQDPNFRLLLVVQEAVEAEIEQQALENSEAVCRSLAYAAA